MKMEHFDSKWQFIYEVGVQVVGVELSNRKVKISRIHIISGFFFNNTIFRESQSVM